LNHASTILSFKPLHLMEVRVEKRNELHKEAHHGELICNCEETMTRRETDELFHSRISHKIRVSRGWCRVFNNAATGCS